MARAALISVCVATYNGERYVADQLSSILQSRLVDEVVVSDDGSSDDTRNIVLSSGDARVRLVSGPQAGLVRNYGHLLTQARGGHIFLADQDDLWMPEKVETMMQALRSVDLVVSDCQVVDEDLNVLQDSFFATHDSGPGLLKNLVRNGYLGCCMAFNRSLLKFALPFPQRLAMHDWWLGLVAESFGSVAFLPRPLVMYRRHPANASSTSGKSSVPLQRQLAWRAQIASDLAGRWLAHRTLPACRR
jgi:glycosyltransferase involved in cell wall biosynthesis